MSEANSSADSTVAGVPPRVFATTHWSVVLAAGQSDSPQRASALETLCRAYWYPLYVFVRRQGYRPEDAQDLTQEFFCRLLDKDRLAQADRRRGKFRTFLLVSLKHFLINEWKRTRRLRRGGGVSFLSLDALEAEARYAVEPLDESSPSQAYEREWAVTGGTGRFEGVTGGWSFVAHFDYPVDAGVL